MGQVNPIDVAENSGLDTRAQGNVIRVTTNDPYGNDLNFISWKSTTGN